MNVTCPNCSTVYRVDPAKVPGGGVRARCAVCAAVFGVTREPGAEAVAPEPAGVTRAAGAAVGASGPTAGGWGGVAAGGPTAVPDTAGQAGGTGVISGEVRPGDLEAEGWPAGGRAQAAPGTQLPGAPEAEGAAAQPAGREGTGLPGAALAGAGPSVPARGPEGAVAAVSGAAAGGAPEPLGTPLEGDMAGRAAAPGWEVASSPGTGPAPSPAAPQGVGAGPSRAPGVRPPAVPPGVTPFRPAVPRPPAGGAGWGPESARISPGPPGAPPAAPPAAPAAVPVARSAAPAGPVPSAKVAAPAGPATPPSPPAASRPAAPGGAAAASPRPAPSPRPVNPFLAQDPAAKARRLARALISDMVVYHPGKRQEGLRDGTLKQLFEEEIKKSWEEYREQVGTEMAESTSYFREALNEILADGRQIF